MWCDTNISTRNHSSMDGHFRLKKIFQYITMGRSYFDCSSIEVQIFKKKGGQFALYHLFSREWKLIIGFFLISNSPLEVFESIHFFEIVPFRLSAFSVDFQVWSSYSVSFADINSIIWSQTCGIIIEESQNKYAFDPLFDERDQLRTIFWQFNRKVARLIDGKCMLLEIPIYRISIFEAEETS